MRLLLTALAGAAAVAAAPDVLVGFAGKGPLLGEPASFYSPTRDEAWVNLTATGYREPLWRLEPLVLEHMTRIFYVHDLLTPEECDHLVTRARSSFARSTVVSTNGGGAVDPIRNSEGTWINRRSDDVMSRINTRISLITHLPVDHQEDMQILKYEKDQHYHPHNDWFHTAPEKSEENGKQRWITILHYLNNYGEDYTGGETIFPESPAGKHQEAWVNPTTCTRGKLAVRPRKGDAVMFYAMSADGIESPGSLHGSCDVVNGTKFSAPVWIRQAPFHVADLPPEGPVPCVDKQAAECPGWAERGECTKNSGFMAKNCRKSCGECK